MGRYMVPGIEELENKLGNNSLSKVQDIDSLENWDSEDEGLPSGVVLMENEHLKRLR